MKPLLLSLLLLLLAACAAPTASTPDPAPTSQSVEVTAAATEAAPPTEVPEQDTTGAELPEVLMTYALNGGIAGFCDTVTVYRERAEWERCTGQSATVPLSEEEQGRLVELVQNYQPFSQSGEDNPKGADSLETTLAFEGQGSEVVTEAVQTELLQIGATLSARARQQ